MKITKLGTVLILAIMGFGVGGLYIVYIEALRLLQIGNIGSGYYESAPYVGMLIGFFIAYRLIKRASYNES